MESIANILNHAIWNMEEELETELFNTFKKVVNKYNLSVEQVFEKFMGVGLMNLSLEQIIKDNIR